MKKVSKPSQIKVKMKGSATRSTAVNIGSLNRTNRMKEKLLKGVNGGSNLGDYNLDAMKLD